MDCRVFLEQKGGRFEEDFTEHGKEFGGGFGSIRVYGRLFAVVDALAEIEISGPQRQLSSAVWRRRLEVTACRRLRR